MEEEQRRVRAHSDHTGRPYFSINYKLSLSAKDLLALALEEMEVIDSDYGDPTPLPPPPPSVSVSQRRNSGFDSSDTFMSKVNELAEKAPGTPSSQYRERKRLGGASTTAHIPVTVPDNKKSNALHDKSVRRTKSAMTMTDIELNRTAPAITNLSLDLNQSQNQTQNMLPGFVTCLNSRNVAKYKVGQRYRDGVVVGIDDDHGKIIVYNENMPRGALTVLKTRDAGKYDKGFVLEDVRGQFLGTVHAVDRVQNLIVLNTAPGSGSGSEVANDGRSPTKVVPPAAPPPIVFATKSVKVN